MKLDQELMSDLKGIPHPELTSWMHRRIEISPLKTTDLTERYAKQIHNTQLEDAIVSRVWKWFHLSNPKVLWGFYHVFMRLIRLFLRFIHRLTVRGQENIPSQGAIFYSNHRGGKDVVVLLSIVEKPVAAFTDINNGWMADAFERFLGFIPRRGLAQDMVEKMIRTLLLKNRYLAMWPEGTPSRHGKIMQGFSSIVKVYAVINAKRNVIPFVPVLMRGTEENGKFQKKNKGWKKKFVRDRRFRKILVEFLKPVFIPRTWLRPPQEGGKTPRQIIDALMMLLARKLGQDHLERNPRLEERRTCPGRPWH